MATTKFNGTPVVTVGELPKVGDKAPDVFLTAQDLNDFSIDGLKGKNIVLNIFPSLDTDVCAASVRRFNQDAASLPDTVVVCVSADLPFAAKRFCVANGIENVMTGSTFRSEFGEKYGVEIQDTPFRGLMARAVVVIDKEGNVKYSEIVEDITHEPDYEAAEKALK